MWKFSSCFALLWFVQSRPKSLNICRFPTCEVEITFHLAWEFYLASHGQTESCSSIAGIEIWKVYELCTVLINMKEVGFCLWCSLDCGTHQFLAPQFRKPHLPLGEHRAQTRLSWLELITRNLVVAHARTKRKEAWLALVQHHNRESGKCGVFWAALPLGWISTCCVAWRCSGDTACTSNNFLGSSPGCWAECRLEVKEEGKETKCGYLGVVKFGRFVRNALLCAPLRLGAITFSIKEDIFRGYTNQKKSFMWMCGRWCEGNISFFGDLLPHFSHYYCLPSLLTSPYRLTQPVTQEWLPEHQGAAEGWQLKRDWPHFLDICCRLFRCSEGSFRGLR